MKIVIVAVERCKCHVQLRFSYVSLAREYIDLPPERSKQREATDKYTYNIQRENIYTTIY